MVWKRRVLWMGERQSKRRGPYWVDPLDVVDGADVVWIVWDTDTSSPKFRVVRGRHLVGPGLRHGVVVVGSEICGLAAVEGRGVRVALMDDGETPGIPEPAVPQAHIEMVMSDHVLLHNGRVLRFPIRTRDQISIRAPISTARSTGMRK